MIYNILLLVVLDLVLTHYLFFLDRKKDVLDMSCEKNWIPRLIMGKNPHPINFISGSFVNILIFGFVIILLGEFMMGIVFGMLIFVNYSHYHQVMDRRRNWGNDKYWKILKIERKVKV